MLNKYSLKDLSIALQISKEALTKRYLSYFGIEINKQERKKAWITIEQIKQNDDLYISMLLTDRGETPKVFITLKELQQYLKLSKDGARKWIARQNIATHRLGNATNGKIIIWATSLYENKKHHGH